MATQSDREYAQAEFGRDAQADPKPTQDDLWDSFVLALNGQEFDAAREALEELLSQAICNGTGTWPSVPINVAGLSILADAMDLAAKEAARG
jgi:hypothetical protein